MAGKFFLAVLLVSSVFQEITPGDQKMTFKEKITGAFKKANTEMEKALEVVQEVRAAGELFRRGDPKGLRQMMEAAPRAREVIKAVAIQIENTYDAIFAQQEALEKLSDGDPRSAPGLHSLRGVLEESRARARIELQDIQRSLQQYEDNLRGAINFLEDLVGIGNLFPEDFRTYGENVEGEDDGDEEEVREEDIEAGGSNDTYPSLVLPYADNMVIVDIWSEWGLADDNGEPIEDKNVFDYTRNSTTSKAW